MGIGACGVVIAHVVGQAGAQVEAILESQVRRPGGANKQTVRVVSENSRILKFASHEFEKE